MSEIYGNDDDICKVFGISKSRLRAKLSANEPLPPRIEIPESRVRLWRMSEVYNWINKFETKEDAIPSRPAVELVRRSKGKNNG